MLINLCISSGNSSIAYNYDMQFNLTSISHNSFAYNFNYDVYCNLIATKVGSQTIASYTYEYGRGILTSVTYGDGDVISYVYDEFDRAVGIKVNNEFVAIICYNKKGLVARVYDSELYLTIDYDYDFNGNLVSEVRRDTDNVFSYSKSSDNEGNLVEVTNIDGVATTIVTGTNDNGDSVVSKEGITVTSETDDFGRLGTVITKYDNTTPDDALNDTNNCKKQWGMLLGLALHTLQDYFAHMVKVDIYKTKGNYYGRRGSVYEKTFYDVYMFSADESSYMDIGKFDDNPQKFHRRFVEAQNSTKILYQGWSKNKKIESIKLKKDKSQSIIKNYKAKGYYWQLQYFQQYLKISFK